MSHPLLVVAAALPGVPPLPRQTFALWLLCAGTCVTTGAPSLPLHDAAASDKRQLFWSSSCKQKSRKTAVLSSKTGALRGNVAPLSSAKSTAVRAAVGGLLEDLALASPTMPRI